MLTMLFGSSNVARYNSTTLQLNHCNQDMMMMTISLFGQLGLNKYMGRLMWGEGRVTVH
jgi:hypothetical protein